jgi:two-component system sensor histidine kinase BaeS
VLQETASAFEAEAARRGIRLAIEAGPGTATFRMDRGTIGQVLSNLVSNALRYTPAGGSVTLGASREDGALVLTVRDTGHGIDPAALPHVFDRFTRADPSRHDSEHAGLGLAIAKALVEAHGGTIAVESEPGRGTAFTIRLRG